MKLIREAKENQKMLNEKNYVL